MQKGNYSRILLYANIPAHTSRAKRFTLPPHKKMGHATLERLRLGWRGQEYQFLPQEFDINKK
jgi:hypothetical protein